MKILKNRTQYYIENKAKILAQQKQYKIENKEKIKERNRLYFIENKEERLVYNKEYDKKKLKEDINYKLARRLRNRLWYAIKKGYKAGSAVKDLGCSLQELKKYLEKQWQPGMSWKNWSFGGWHIDHIIPLASFDLEDREQFLEANHYTNLQPLWAEDNLKKSMNKS
jgi:hypothetical protein